MNKIERAERYIPEPDISDVVKRHKIEIMDRVSAMVQRISYVVLEAAFLTPKVNNTLDIGFSKDLRFYITCTDPNSDDLSLNPHWKQYEVNGQYVGNIHGMERFIAEECWKDIRNKLEEVLNG